MTLGEKIKQARLDRHMTQREVVGDYITRNMLSKIENNSATPSMKTLEYLAAQLGLPTGYFVSEDAVALVPQSLQSARQAYAKGKYALSLQLLEDAEETGQLDEQLLLQARCHLALAEAASRSGDGTAALAHAQTALECNQQTIYSCELLEARAALLAARFDAASFANHMDRYESAQHHFGLERMYHLTMAQHYLDAGEVQHVADELNLLDGDAAQQESDYLRLRGELAMYRKDYEAAVTQLKHAEQLVLSAGSSELTLAPLYAMLEQCYRELEDYKEAYYYASKQIQR